MDVRIVAVTQFSFDGREITPREVLSVPQHLADKLVRTRQANYYCAFGPHEDEIGVRQSRVMQAPSIAATIESPGAKQRGICGFNLSHTSGRRTSR